LKDKDFDSLLQDSVKTYGHTYFTEAWDQTPHTFPEGFFDNIVSEANQTIPYSPQMSAPVPDKKPLLLRMVPYMAAMAAVLLLVTVVSIVVATQFNQVEVENYTSVKTAPADGEESGFWKGAGPNTTEDSYHSQYSNQMNEAQNIEEDSQTITDNKEISQEQDRFAEEPASVDQAAEEPYDTFYLPMNTVAQVQIKGQTVTVNRYQVSTIVRCVVDSMKMTYRSSTNLFVKEEMQTADILVTAEGNMTVYGVAYQSFHIQITDAGVYITCRQTNSDHYYVLPSDDALYDEWISTLNALSA
jgi:hypothetical protein